jgi:hypothetical protein
VIRLTARVSDHGYTYTLARDGELLVTTGNRADMADWMLAAGIESPMKLIEAAEHWEVVDIHEEPG